MNAFSGSHCNSRCESGWTTYFEESLDTDGRFRPSVEEHGGRREVEEEEEADLSMISDASSGPKNLYYEENNYWSILQSEGSSATKSRRNQHHCLDDTASSPVFGLSKTETKPYTKEGFVENVREASQSHSRKQHGKKQTSLFRSSSSTKLAKNVTGGFEEAKWEQ